MDVRETARAFVAGAFDALREQFVIPTPVFHPYVQVGRDYFGDTIRAVPAYHDLETRLDELYPHRFAEPLKRRHAEFASGYIFSFLRRLPCPSDPSVLPADVGRTNFCIDTSLQAYKDSGNGAVPVGPNARISQFTWDPEQPGQHLGGLSQYPCAGARDPCPRGGGFIGDYFGLAVSQQKIYALMVSTHYPSDVTADEGGPIYYQQQLLATVPRIGFGAGY